MKKQLLKNITESIGMKNVNIINESLAITMYYGYSKYRDMFITEKIKENKSIEKNIIFIDIGHSKTSFIFSTFNYAEFKTIKVKNLNNLGSRNFDRKLFLGCKDLKYKLTRESFKKIIKDELMILKKMKFKILKKI